MEGIRLLARTTGVFTETAGGVTAGVLRKLAERGEIGAGETVVVYITGDGLKTIDAVRAGRAARSRCRPIPTRWTRRSSGASPSELQ